MEEKITLIEEFKVTLQQYMEEQGLSYAELSNNAKTYVDWLLLKDSISERQVRICKNVLKEN